MYVKKCQLHRELCSLIQHTPAYRHSVANSISGNTTTITPEEILTLVNKVALQALAQNSWPVAKNSASSAQTALTKQFQTSRPVRPLETVGTS